MAKTIPGRLPKLAEQQAVTVEHLVLNALNEADGVPYRAAAIIGVSPTTIRRWLQENGYVAKQQPVLWVKEGEAV